LLELPIAIPANLAVEPYEARRDRFLQSHQETT
jgi:hypothetical protein